MRRLPALPQLERLDPPHPALSRGLRTASPQRARVLLRYQVCVQVLFKAPITESKQVEHVVNERITGQAAGTHPLCVRLHAAFQDERCLYLLQDFVPGARRPFAHLKCGAEL